MKPGISFKEDVTRYEQELRKEKEELEVALLEAVAEKTGLHGSYSTGDDDCEEEEEEFIASTGSRSFNPAKRGMLNSRAGTPNNATSKSRTTSLGMRRSTTSKKEEVVTDGEQFTVAQDDAKEAEKALFRHLDHEDVQLIYESYFNLSENLDEIAEEMIDSYEKDRTDKILEEKKWKEWKQKPKKLGLEVAKEITGFNDEESNEDSQNHENRPRGKDDGGVKKEETDDTVARRTSAASTKKVVVSTQTSNCVNDDAHNILSPTTSKAIATTSKAIATSKEVEVDDTVAISGRHGDQQGKPNNCDSESAINDKNLSSAEKFEHMRKIQYLEEYRQYSGRKWKEQTKIIHIPEGIQVASVNSNGEQEDGEMQLDNSRVIASSESTRTSS